MLTVQKGGEAPMSESTTTATRETTPGVVDNDLVPVPWKTLFNNEEWLIHRIIVLTSYGGLAIAVLAHILVYLWNPWLQLAP
jgi:light-harvesting complex 1 beta chain